jgi:dipeptidase E
MIRRPPTIVAMGGGGFSMEDDGLLDGYILGLTQRRRPKVLFLPTATSSVATYVVKFYAAFADRAQVSFLDLFERGPADLRDLVIGQDAIYVGGGNTANLLAIWRAHGLDRLLREAWQEGVVLAGQSAGAMCWFESGVTDSFGPLAALRDGLALLSGSFCPHYDGEPERRPTYQRLVHERTLPSGMAADDGAALVFEGRTLREVVASRPGACGYRVRLLEGEVAETALPAHYLGAD